MKLPLIVSVIALIFVMSVAVYTSDFTAYLGNNPSTCNNCHVMDDVYEGWYHAGHKQWTTCNECHTPHELISKYWVKAVSGYHHVTTFYFGEIPVAIRAKESSKKVVQENCVRCHETTITNLDWDFRYNRNDTERYCFDCHRTQAHGKRGIAILPYQHVEKNQ